ncbi:hypothetical protein RVY76_06655 [Palleronia sp. LCG004]|nr:hypothetical protein [Palleronia sp. LCG004]WOI57458.1 hypothetical protein RVY76_06655 [Palleronia sp. LCG004]
MLTPLCAGPGPECLSDNTHSGRRRFGRVEAWYAIFDPPDLPVGQTRPDEIRRKIFVRGEPRHLDQPGFSHPFDLGLGDRAGSPNDLTDGAHRRMDEKAAPQTDAERAQIGKKVSLNIGSRGHAFD